MNNEYLKQLIEYLEFLLHNYNQKDDIVVYITYEINRLENMGLRVGE